MQRSTSSVPGTRRAACVRGVGLVALGLIVAAWMIPGPVVTAQQPAPKRLNRMIEALESGKQAISGDTWVWIEQEHNPWNILATRATLALALLNRNAQGQPNLAPIVQIPGSIYEGENPIKWM